MNEIIQKARAWALEEIEKTNKPAKELFELSNLKGQQLAEQLGGDKDLVMAGTLLMDIKLGQSIEEGKREEHTQRSAQAAKQFLENFDIDEETKNKIINCVEAHHGTKEYICLEAEICANADCYRFLHPKGVFTYFKYLGKELDELDKIINKVEAKLDEKWNILSLDICKQELEPYYKMFKELFKKTKEEFV